MSLHKTYILILCSYNVVMLLVGNCVAMVGLCIDNVMM